MWKTREFLDLLEYHEVVTSFSEPAGTSERLGRRGKQPGLAYVFARTDVIVPFPFSRFCSRVVVCSRGPLAHQTTQCCPRLCSVDPSVNVEWLRGVVAAGL